MVFEDEQTTDLTSIFIIKHPALLSNGLGQSISVIIPEGYGLSMLRRFVYSGCKAIGEREHRKLMLECGREVFPVDYPEAQLAHQYHHENAI